MGFTYTYFWTTSSPLGELLLHGTDEGLLSLEYITDEDQQIGRLLQLTDTLHRKEACFTTICNQLEEYFSHQRTAFDVTCDLRLCSNFQRQLCVQLSRIPFGSLDTYGSLARKMNSPGAARAVGAALVRNPLPLIYPCHRVVNSHGNFGGYIGGIERKQRLLAFESALLV